MLSILVGCALIFTRRFAEVLVLEQQIGKLVSDYLFCGVGGVLVQELSIPALRLH